MTSSALMRTSDGGPELTVSHTEVVTAATEVRKLTAALNRMMAWPARPDTTRAATAKNPTRTPRAALNFF
jgi:hypothetical protein